MDNDQLNNDITDTAAFDNFDNDAIIKVIGIGGGGGNAVNYMYRQNIPNVNFVVCNTDKQALSVSPVPNKLILGYDITHGRGAGNKPDVGRACAEASADDIRKLFDDQTEMVFITAGMGGGTGTGAAPVVARIARDAGMLTIGIVTVPFLFEGESKIIKALEGAEELKKHVDALLVINNENLVELYKDYSVFNAFEKADDTLANAARSISEIISEKMFINVDFQDVKTVLKDSGTAIISTAFGEGERRVKDAIDNALHSPLLKKHDIKSSKRLLFKFSCAREAEHPLQASEINDITSFTSELGSTIDVKWGIADNPELGDKVKVTVLASGFDVTLRESKNGENGPGPVLFPSGFTDEPEDEQQSSGKGKEQMVDFYGKEKLRQKGKIADRQKYVVLQPDQYDDHEIVALLERTPTYNRDSGFKELIGQATEAARAERAGEKPAHRHSNNPDDVKAGGSISFGMGDIDD
mgnify:CR=1 FL=1